MGMVNLTLSTHQGAQETGGGLSVGGQTNGWCKEQRPYFTFTRVVTLSLYGRNGGHGTTSGGHGATKYGLWLPWQGYVFMNILVCAETCGRV